MNDPGVLLRFRLRTTDSFASTWYINDFSERCKAGRVAITSPEFCVGDFRWSICLIPRGSDETNKQQFVSIFLDSYEFFQGTHEQTYLFVKYFMIVSIRGKVYKSFYAKIHMNSPDNEIENKSMRKGGVRHRLQVDNDLGHDQFNILCCITLVKSHYPIIDEQYFNSLIREANVLDKSWNFNEYLNNNKFSDIKFLVDDREFYAHKNILANESEVFATMFERLKMKHQRNIIKLEDIDHEVMMEMLRYIYTGKVYEIENVAENLLEASDKYKLKGLKVLCEVSLCENLTTANVIKYLKLASLYKAEMLEDYAIDFIAYHAKDIVHSPQFKVSIKDLRLDVITDIFSFITSQSQAS